MRGRHINGSVRQAGMLAWAVTACAALAACAPDTSTPASSAPSDLGAAVSAARAKTLFDAVCGASLPNFASAPARMSANGITRSSPIGSGLRYGATEDISFSVQDGPGFGNTCSMVLGTNDDPQRVIAAVLGPATAVVEGMGQAALYPGTKALMTGRVAPASGGRNYVNIRMMSGRQGVK